jgi:tRNA threonylcarbamoyladenosine biosynthesis protein TsaB
MTENASRPLLAVDTATPRVSVALVRGDAVVAVREGAQRDSSARLIGWIDEVMREGSTTLAELGGAVALRGPGSFTGLRVGLATLLGFHQALGLRVAALPTLEVLAAATSEGAGVSRRVTALVPAGPSEWFAQTYETGWPPRALGDARRVPATELAGTAPGTNEAAADGSFVVAADVERDRLARIVSLPVHVAPLLAPVAALLVSRHPPAWDASLLSEPLYLAPPPVTVPGAPKPVMPLDAGRAR